MPHAERGGPESGHSTALQAAKAAVEAGRTARDRAHQPSPYRDEKVLGEEARICFPETYPAVEGDVHDRKTAGTMTRAEIQLVRALADKRGRTSADCSSPKGRNWSGELRASGLR